VLSASTAAAGVPPRRGVRHAASSGAHTAASSGVHTAATEQTLMEATHRSLSGRLHESATTRAAAHRVRFGMKTSLPHSAFTPSAVEARVTHRGVSFPVEAAFVCHGVTFGVEGGLMNPSLASSMGLMARGREVPVIVSA
jgi:hypothetical protein